MELNIFNTGSKFIEAKELVKEVYLADERPWVVGFSGGKDSTAVVQLVFQALSELDTSSLSKKVYVISSDTQVETPLIINKITRTLGRIQSKALELGLPIETQKVRPKVEQTFWSSIIGKGYPTPRQKFRWCTDRLKIDPANRFILDKVDQFGEVIMLLGVRDSESSTRAAVMQSHTIEGKKLMRHSTLRNAFVFAPIRAFSLDDVWEFLLQYESPWGDDNNELLQLYQDSSSECPLVVDKQVKESAGSCGNSRFGCWTCTVVNEDKALSGFINSGVDWLRPLYEFRNFFGRN
ncbi:DNA phosphorothioation system sulfurtransferase DndC [Paenibacillus sp. RC343]|uniref:DNA phosphorothioation system sulfurtransferase DndC n=1 Tax=Paenibacillus sp. RC343 TaxID=3045841 RepID=UPI0024B9E9C5|nr:DNA phosphorothioation system sulfurtransferase DndC [Paenibacillus sp. RC343]